MEASTVLLWWFIPQHVSSSVQQLFSSVQQHSRSDQLDFVRCLNHIADSHLQKLGLVLYENELEPWSEGIFQGILLAQRWPICILSKRKPQTFHNIYSARKASTIIVFFKSSQEPTSQFRYFLENKLWNPKARVIFVLPEAHDPRGFLKALWDSARVANVVLMTNVSIFAAQPYSEPKLFSHKDCLSGEWFPGLRRPLDLHGSSLVVAAVKNEPYVTPGKSLVDFKGGLQIWIVEELGKFFNLSITYVSFPKGHNPYAAVVQGRPHGLFHVVHSGIADLTCSGVSITLQRAMFAEPLIPHLMDYRVWIVPVLPPSRQFFNIYQVFSFGVWLAVTMSHFAFSIALWGLLRYQVDRNSIKSFLRCLFDIYAGMLAQGCAILNNTTSLKLFMVAFLLYSLHVSSFYQSALITLLTSPTKDKQFDTPEEAVDAHLTAYLFPSDGYNASDHKLWNMINESGRVEYMWDPALVTRKVAVEKVGITYVRKLGFTFILEDYIAPEEIQHMRILKDKSVEVQVTMFMTLGHPLISHFDRKIRQLMEAGLVSLKLQRVSHGRLRLLSGTTHKKQDGAETLTMSHMAAAFVLLLIGWIMGLVVFCLELIYKRTNKHPVKKVKITEKVKN